MTVPELNTESTNSLSFEKRRRLGGLFAGGVLALLSTGCLENAPPLPDVQLSSIDNERILSSSKERVYDELETLRTLIENERAYGETLAVTTQDHRLTFTLLRESGVLKLPKDEISLTKIKSYQLDFTMSSEGNGTTLEVDIRDSRYCMTDKSEDYVSGYYGSGRACPYTIFDGSTLSLVFENPKLSTSDQLTIDEATAYIKDNGTSIARFEASAGIAREQFVIEDKNLETEAEYATLNKSYTGKKYDPGTEPTEQEILNEALAALKGSIQQYVT